MKVDQMITEDEAALYDRQIRLWGVEAQRKLLSSRILLVNMSGMGAEIAKNLVLSGVHLLTILDPTTVTVDDLRSNFLLPHDSIGKNRAESSKDALQNLNPMVRVIADAAKLEDKDEAFFGHDNFDIICVLSDDLAALKKLDEIARKNGVLFISGYIYGFHGYMFVDFNDYNYLVEATKITTEESTDTKKTTSEKAAACATSKQQANEKLELEERNMKFKSLDEFLQSFTAPIENITPKKLKRMSKTYFIMLVFNEFFKTHNRAFQWKSAEDKDLLIEVKKSLFEKMNLNAEILSDAELIEQAIGEQCAVNAILGGVVAQEIIKSISRKNDPIDNLFMFDGNQMNGDVLKI